MIPISQLLILYLAVFLAGTALDLVLTRVNVRHVRQHGTRVPDRVKGYIEQGRLSKIADYTAENQSFHVLTSSINSALLVVIILSGLLPWFFTVIQSVVSGRLLSGIMFLGGFALGMGFCSLPFNYYKTFVIEQRYGFNTSTLRTWFVDILKGLVLACLIGGTLLVSVLSLMEHGGHLWWLWAWLVFFGIQALLLLIYPSVIAPWFNKFVPLEDEALEDKVKGVMRRAGLTLDGIFKMDAGKRSRHTNAYFTGLGKSKRIVLFDTLLASHGHEEIVAIVAHEMGHWKKRHVMKSLLLLSFFSFVLFFLASRLVTWPVLYRTFGFDHVASSVGLLLVGLLWEAAAEFLVPIGNAVSRRFEREADMYAVGVQQKTTNLASALKRLAMDNLSNLYPHPLYASFYYSHPPLLQRIEYLESVGQK